ncbi:radical SAM protein [uncultured Helicobacter sp.]|uniref:radical SAM protein n=1 Tax=uncultured Helicobacter sp. TaxID=175537 RepID=UPI0026064562|nr:radical SAM protein [uncultured Helicobacter sp.]
MDIIFGPVHSRRFGESLGVDLSPHIKQCNYDCLYCELKGKKAQDSMESLLSVDEVLGEIKKGLEHFPNVESLTITANGEPTLYPYLYELMLRLEDIKGATQTLLLTNGSLLYDISVARACLLFDKVKFSLDAVSEEVFKKIDRPSRSVELQQILQGIYHFSADFEGELYAEVLFVENINDSLEEVKKMAKFLAPMRLKRLDIGTIDRPPAYQVKGISGEKLESLGEVFLTFGIPTFIAKRVESKVQENLILNRKEILKTLALRPQSMQDIKMLWHLSTQEILQDLLKNNVVEIVENNGVKFYQIMAKA